MSGQLLGDYQTSDDWPETSFCTSLTDSLSSAVFPSSPNDSQNLWNVVACAIFSVLTIFVILYHLRKQHKMFQ